MATHAELADLYAPKFIRACENIDAAAVRLPGEQMYLMALTLRRAREYVAGECAAFIFLDAFARFGGEKNGISGGMVHISDVLARFFDRVLAGPGSDPGWQRWVELGQE